MWLCKRGTHPAPYITHIHKQKTALQLIARPFFITDQSISISNSFVLKHTLNKNRGVLRAGISQSCRYLYVAEHQSQTIASGYAHRSGLCFGSSRFHAPTDRRLFCRGVNPIAPLLPQSAKRHFQTQAMCSIPRDAAYKRFLQLCTCPVLLLLVYPWRF